MGKKVTREEFESYKISVQEDLLVVQRKSSIIIKNEVALLKKDLKDRLSKLELKNSELNNAIKMLQPRIDESRLKDDTIINLGREIEDMRTERIALKTRNSNLMKELNELKASIAKKR